LSPRLQVDDELLNLFRAAILLAVDEKYYDNLSCRMQRTLLFFSSLDAFKI
jgi:hypothetical protein